MKSPLLDTRRSSPSQARRRAVRPSLEGLEDRLLLYATNGGSWVYASRITMSFVPDGTNVAGTPSNLFATLNRVASTATWEAAFEKAAAIWSSVANINIAMVPDDGTAMGTTGNQQDAPDFGDIRISMTPLTGGVLAYAFLPPPLNGGSSAGDIVMNSNISWVIGNTGNGYDLETVALHEIGHALGMDHSPVSSDVMYAYYNGANQNVSSDDSAGIQSIYGAPPADTGGNNSLPTAKNINSLINANLQINDSGLYLSGSADAQVYTVTVPAGTSGTMTVSMQSTNLSLLNPGLLLYNGAKQQIAGVSAPNSYGATVTISVSGVTAGQQYYFVARMSSAPGTYGAYGLLVNFGSKSQAPIAPPNTVVAAQMSQGGGSENETIAPTVTADDTSDAAGLTTGITNLWGDVQPALADPDATDPGSSGDPATGGAILTWVGDSMQFTFANGTTNYGEALRATLPAGGQWPDPVGPFSTAAISGAGATSTTAVVNLPAITPVAITPPQLPTSAAQAVAPWTPANPQTQDAALALWGSAGDGASDGYSFASFRARHRHDS